MKNIIKIVLVTLIFVVSNVLAQSCPSCPSKTICEEEKELKHGKEKIVEKKIFVAPEFEDRGFLGVITEESEKGLQIIEVVPESPAEIAGLKPGDVVLEINGKKTTTPEELRKIIGQFRPGEEVEFKVLKEGEEKLIKIKLAPMPKSPKRMVRKEMPFETQGGAGYFGPGLGFINYRELNNLFALNFIPNLKRNHFMFGGGGYAQINRIRIGGYGVGGVQSVNNDQLNIEAGLGIGVFELGYSVVYTKGLLLTPYLGIGGGGISLKITPLGNRPARLDDILGLNANFGVSKVSKGGLILLPGISLDIPLIFTGLSFKAGYLYSPLSGSWEHEDYGQIAGPDFNLQGIYTSLNVLFGGFERPRRKK
ncbi:MAG: PDZ domain-containing protein [candidate division WOR-3 bacterium]|nr:PDZ domain-containing protein [candidate division WOR-3 bacterium]